MHAHDLDSDSDVYVERLTYANPDGPDAVVRFVA